MALLAIGVPAVSVAAAHDNRGTELTGRRMCPQWETSATKGDRQTNAKSFIFIYLHSFDPGTMHAILGGASLLAERERHVTFDIVDDRTCSSSLLERPASCDGRRRWPAGSCTHPESGSYRVGTGTDVTRRFPPGTCCPERREHEIGAGTPGADRPKRPEKAAVALRYDNNPAASSPPSTYSGDSLRSQGTEADSAITSRPGRSPRRAGHDGRHRSATRADGRNAGGQTGVTRLVRDDIGHHINQNTPTRAGVERGHTHYADEPEKRLPGDTPATRGGYG